jgi:PKHD-type hydroxylase
MFIEIENLLGPPALARLAEIGAKAKFVDGRVSNPHNPTKKNLQIDTADPLYQESMQIVGNALLTNEEVRNFAFIQRLAPPLMCKYTPAMTYGRHSDSAFLPMAPAPLRSDLSCTVFLAAPETYEGGELTIYLGSKPVTIKGNAGAAILYPSTTIHEVVPVRKGERLVSITFIQSQINDERQRDLLYTLNEVAALEGNTMAWENRVRLELVRQSLHRMWSS